MNKKPLILLLTICVFITSCKTLGDLGVKPSHLENITAIKKVLNSSTVQALKSLREINRNGGEGTLPKEIQPVLNTLKNLGYEDQIGKITKGITAASDVLLTESETITKDAIDELKIKDAAAIILGGEDAATVVLKEAMYTTIKSRYSEKIESELSKTGALLYWPSDCANTTISL